MNRLNRSTLFSVLLLFFCLAGFSFASQNILSLSGKKGWPFFDSQGKFNLVYINSEGGISLAKAEKDDREIISIQNFICTRPLNSLLCKKDSTGNIWLVWEEGDIHHSDIHAAELRNNQLVNQTNITGDQRGFNFSPCLDFSLGNELWVAWINFFQDEYTLQVKNVTTGQTWQFSSTVSSSALSPQIIADGTGLIWLFWVGHPRNHDEILYTRFDGQAWSLPSSLNSYSDVPHINPWAALDFRGFPQLAWSAFDGEDYELYLSRWDGKKWTRPLAITHDRDAADTHPCLALFLGTIPVVAWSRYDHGKRQVGLAYRMNEEWVSRFIFSGEETMTSPPRLIISEEKLGVSWQVESGIKTALFHVHEWLGPFFHKQKNILFSPAQPIKFVHTKALDRDKYIGFGDSITLGVLNLEPAPEKGYIPRLEKLIHKNIHDSQVINRGIGGEKTAEGLSRIRSVIREDQAKTIFLMEGTNDIKDQSISMDTAAFNLRKMCERCLDFRMKVLLASTIPTSPWEKETIKNRVRDLNKKIRSIASDLGLTFVDQFDVFSVNSDKNYNLYSDSTHPNQEGYQLMAEAWFQALLQTIPSVDTDKTLLSFEGTKGESNPPSQAFRIRNSGQETLHYQISTGQEWLSVSPQSGESAGEWDEIQVAVDLSPLVRGNYQGLITISSDYASNSPQTITVDLAVLGPVIELDQTSLSFEGTKGESEPSPKTFKIRNSAEGTLRYQISTGQEWLSVSPQSGESAGEWDEIQVAVDLSPLVRGNYQGFIDITSAHASPQQLFVDLTVYGPEIETDKSSLSFTGKKGTSDPPAQTFKIKNSKEGTLHYQIQDNRDWLSVSPQSGDSSGEWDQIQVSVDITRLSEGDYTGKITISSADASNSPQYLTANLNIYIPPLFQPLHFQGEKKENRSLSQLEYISILTWEANPENQEIIKKYRVYQVEQGNMIFLKEVDLQTFEYWHRQVEKDKVYTYGLTAGDIYGRESEPVYTEVR
ncbi:MAG: BACON domain-containing protein [Candidatus Aminicenantes bacterium]